MALVRRIGIVLPLKIVLALVSLSKIPETSSLIRQENFHRVSKNITSLPLKSVYLSLKTECAAVCSRTSECTYVLYSGTNRVCQLYSDGIFNKHDGQQKVLIYQRRPGSLVGPKVKVTSSPKLSNERFTIILHRQRKTWDQAIRACQSKGWTLAMPKTKEKAKLMRRTSQRISLNLETWIGLKDADGNNTYRWIDGDSLTYTNWHKGEPNVMSERCVTNIVSHLPWNEGWYDLHCDQKRYFVCQHH